MRHLLIALIGLFLMVFAPNVHADDATDTVVLVNGGRVRGTVVDDPTQGVVTIRMADGKMRTLKRAEGKPVEYGGRAKPPPTYTAIAPVRVETAQYQADGQRY